MRYRIGANYGAARTTLLFQNGERFNFQQMAATVSFEWRQSKKLTLSGSVGGLFQGRLSTADQTFRLGPGIAASFAVSYFALEQLKFRPFIMVSGSLAVSAVMAQPTNYFAGDVRASIASGYTFFDRLTTYLTARVFGGPVFWKGSTGTDLYHVQLGIGAVVGLPGNIDVSAEIVPLGEQRISAGVGLSF